MRKILSLVLLCLTLGINTYVHGQCNGNAPIINTFTPNTGFIGSTVTITGANFDPTPANNQVFFGATQATVLTSSFGVITVTVPVGASTAPISVKNGCNLTAYSNVSFNGIFCPTPITATTYNNTAFSIGAVGAYNMLSQDLDADGKPDVVSAYNGLTVARNISTPGTLNFQRFDFGTGGNYNSYISTADFDGDGKRDLFGTHNLYRNTSTGPGSISFTIYNFQSLVPGSPTGYQNGVGDFNNDGKIDVVFENAAGTMYFYRNTSTGPGNIGFVLAATVGVNYRSTGIQCVDADGDGKIDVLSTQGDGNRLIALRNTTTAGAAAFSFAGLQSFGTGGAYPYRCQIADFDKDGKIDLTTVNYNSPGNTVNTAVIRNISTVGNIAFATALTYSGPQSNYRVGVGDVNGDGYPDIVTKSLAVQAFAVYTNTTNSVGNITFASRFDYSSAATAEVSGIVIGDLDGDFVPDIATSGTNSGTIRFHRNTSAQVDNTPPTAICKNITVALSPSGTVTVTPQMIDNGSGDACGVGSLQINNSASVTFTCNDIGNNTVTLKVIDKANNISTCTATVTVAPAAIIVSGQTTVCQGQTVTMNANQGDSYQWYKDGVLIPGANSQTYIATVTGDYTVSVTNAGGCSGVSAETSVTVNNNPTVSTTPTGNASLCPPNGNVTLSATLSSIYQWKLNGNNISGATQQTLTVNAAGTYAVQVIDLFGCSAVSAPIVVNATDNINPVAKCQNVTVALDASKTAGVTVADINNGSTDNCGIANIAISGITSYNCSHVGQQVPVTLTVTDNSGNVSTCTALVTVTDPNSYCNVPPVAVCKPVTVSADANCKGVAVATDFDGGSTDADGDVLTYSITPAGPYNIGTTQVKLTVKDPDGETSSCITTITVTDDTPPSITCPANISVNNDPNVCGAVVNYALPVVNDNCSGGIVANVMVNGSFETGNYNGWTIVSNCPSCGIWGIGSNGQVITTSTPILNFANNQTQTVSYPQGLPITLATTDGQKMAMFFQNSGATIHRLYQDVAVPAGSSQLCFDLQYKNFAGAFNASQFLAVEIKNPSTNAVMQTLMKTDPGDPNTTPMTHYCFDMSAFAGQTVRVELIDASINSNPLNVFIDNVTLGSVVSLVQTTGLASGATFPVGTTTNTFVATDASGNTSTCSFTVTVKDVQPPVIACSGNINVIATSAAGAVVNYTTPVGTDNCSGAVTTLVSGLASGSTFPLGTTAVTYLVTDAAGLSAQCSFNVTVTGLPPAIVCPGKIEVPNEVGQCGANVSFTATETVGIPASTITYDHQPGSFFAVGTTTVTATATNAVGTSSCTFTVTVKDVTPPVIACPFNIVVDAEAGTCGATVNYNQPSATDNCGGGTLPTSIPGYTYKGTFGGHTYFVSDSQKAPEDAHAAAIALGGHLATISSAAENAFISAMHPDRMWIGFTDRDVEGTYRWVTNEPITYTNWAGGEPNNAGGNEDWAVINWTGPNWNDWYYTQPAYYVVEFEGGNIPTTLVAGQASGSNFPVGVTVVTYSATDGGGNTVTCSFTVTVNDVERPALVGVPANATVECDAVPAPAMVSATDNCPGVGNVNMTEERTNGNCISNYSLRRTWSVTDAHGNTTTAQQIITVRDTQAPTLTASASDRTVECDGAGNTAALNAWLASHGGANASDNCSGVSWSHSFNGLSDDCGRTGSATVTFTVTDECGNASTTSATFTIVDTQAPTVTNASDMTVECDGTGNTAALNAWLDSNGGANASDVCGSVSWSNDFNGLSDGCGNTGRATVVFTATDACGNKNRTSATFTIVDNTAPSISCPANASVSCDGDMSTAALGSATASDVCSGSVTISSSDASTRNSDVNSAAHYNYTITRAWTAVDACGNSSSCVQTITVFDNTAPVAVSQNVTVTLVNGAASITPSMINNGSTDNCNSPLSLSVSKANFNCSNIGYNTVILTVKDVSGNTSTCTATVKVVGEIPTCSISSIPTDNTYTGGVSTNLYLGYGAQSTTLQVNTPASGAPYTYSWSGNGPLSNSNTANPVFTPTTAGVYNFTVNIVNKYGCTTSCSISICVTDIRVVSKNGSIDAKKVYICHIPPGNPGNAQTLEVSVNAVPAHIGPLGHATDRLGKCTQTACTGNTIAKAPVSTETTDDLSIVLSPNPTSRQFVLQVNSTDRKTAVVVRIMDGHGRMIETQKGSVSQLFTFGSNYSNGAYYIEVMQGEKKKVVKGIKVN